MIEEIIQNYGNVTIAVSAADLREILKETIIDIQKERTAAETVMTADEVVEFLGIGRTTLDAMMKDGRLIPAKIGARSLYRRSDVVRLLGPDPALVIEASRRKPARSYRRRANL